MTLGSYWANRPFQELIDSLNSFEHNEDKTKSFEQASTAAAETKKTTFVKVDHKNPVMDMLSATNEIRSDRYSKPQPQFERVNLRYNAKEVVY